MLSIGVRNGQGFDRESLRKLIEVGKRPYEFDILILGNNAGGMVSAKTAAQHGKKVALVYWRNPTPGEEEGYEENRQHMMETLLMNKNFITERTYDILEQEDKAELMPAVKIVKTSRTTLHDHGIQSRSSKWSRKVRRSKLDLTNAIKNMAVEGLKFIHEVAVTNDSLKIQGKNGKVMPWIRASEEVMDYIIKKNWTILTDFLKNRVSLYDGLPLLMDEHTVLVLKNKGGERLITAETIISALEIRNTFPKDVVGAKEFGINLDDFFRLSSPPGRTLIVGAGPRGMECAGILASFGFPVVVIDRSTIPRNGDPEIVAMIMKDLGDRGVIFIEKKSLVSIRKSKTGENLEADFSSGQSSVLGSRKKQLQEFDTILFTTREKLDVKESGKTALHMEIERLTGEMYFPEEKYLFENIIVIPDQRNSVASTEVIGNHVINQLLDMEEYPPKLSLIPNIVMTPLEYAYIGLSENSARRRFGEDCVQVFTGNFPTEDFLKKHDIKDEVCFAKILTMFDKDLIIGLHLFGRDAIKIMNEVMEPIERKMLVSRLHPTLKAILGHAESEEQLDEVILTDVNH